MTTHSPCPEKKPPRLNLHALLCTMLAPALLTAVATHKLLDENDALKTPWKGGAFGMFSSIDYPPARLFRVSLIVDDQSIPVILDRRFDETMRIYKNMPASENLAKLAEELDAHTWAYPSDMPLERILSGDPQYSRHIRTMGYQNPPRPGYTRLGHEGVNVQIWRYDFDSSKARTTMVMINEAEGRYEE